MKDPNSALAATYVILQRFKTNKLSLKKSPECWAKQDTWGQNEGSLIGLQDRRFMIRHLAWDGNKNFKDNHIYVKIGSGQLSGFFDPGQGPWDLPSNSPLASFKLANEIPVTTLLLLYLASAYPKPYISYPKTQPGVLSSPCDCSTHRPVWTIKIASCSCIQWLSDLVLGQGSPRV